MILDDLSLPESLVTPSCYSSPALRRRAHWVVGSWARFPFRPQSAGNETQPPAGARTQRARRRGP